MEGGTAAAQLLRRGGLSLWHIVHHRREVAYKVDCSDGEVVLLLLRCGRGNRGDNVWSWRHRNHRMTQQQQQADLHERRMMGRRPFKV